MRRRPINKAAADASSIKLQVDGSGTGSRESESGPLGIGLMVIVEPADIVRLHTAMESAAIDAAVESLTWINVPPLMSYI